MKIKKFNENIGQNWSFDKFEELSNLQKQLRKINNELEVYLKEYIFLHPELTEDGELEDEIKIVEINVLDRNDPRFSKYKLEPDDYLEVVFIIANQRNAKWQPLSAWFNKENVEDFLIFMQDPEAYKDAKKYNL